MPFRVLLLSILVLAPCLVSAHETIHEVARGRAVAVKASHLGGEALADTPYEVYSPADAKVPHQKGRTDRAGWLAFVPDAPGKWRVKVIDHAGHGLDVQVDADAPAAKELPPAAAPAPASVFVLRPLVGLAVIGAVFAALYFTYRRKGSPRH